jgi:hypothetical protein
LTNCRLRAAVVFNRPNHWLGVFDSISTQSGFLRVGYGSQIPAGRRFFLGWSSYKKDWRDAEFTSQSQKRTLGAENKRRLAMKGTLFVLVLFVLRLGIPALVLLSIGEILKRRPGDFRAGGR